MTTYLLKYTYYTYSQGTRDRGVDYALIHVPYKVSFANLRSALIKQRFIEGEYEIDIDSVEDLTIQY